MAIADVEQNQLSAEEAAGIVANDLRDAYFFRLRDSFTALEAAALNEDWATVQTQVNAIREALSNYQPVELTPAEIAERGQLLYLFTDLVYVEYKDGVRDGQITIAIEYQEAITLSVTNENTWDTVYDLIGMFDYLEIRLPTQIVPTPTPGSFQQG